MELICYPLLSTRSRRALQKRKGRWGHRYQYVPRANLIDRLARELNLPVEQVHEQLQRERNFLLKHDLI
jgi:hypothetical protein